MPNSKQIVYLSQSQYAELIANGTITVDGVTVTYDENDIYVTPQAEPVTDVRINGTSIAANGVADIPMATATTAGAIIIGDGLQKGSTKLLTNPATAAQIKAGIKPYEPIVPSSQHISTFYGLSKAAGHDEASSTEPLGTYTPEAKGAIQSMLGVSDLIAPEENNLVASKAYTAGEVFTANGKLYKATTAIAQDAAIIPAVEGEEIEGANCVETSVGEEFVKFTDYADNNSAQTQRVGIIGLTPVWSGVRIINGAIHLSTPSVELIKQGTDTSRTNLISQQHQAAFYGLAKAAGADEKDSTLPVGQYTDTAKSAIRSMLGATSNNVIAVQDTQPTDSDTKIWLPETAETPVQIPTMEDMNTALAGKVGDVQVNGTSVVENGIANIPIGSTNNYGLMRSANGITSTNGVLRTYYARETEIKTGTESYNVIVPATVHTAAFYGLAKAAGDTTQSASDNAVGTYTDDAKSAIRTMLGAVGSEDYATADNYGIVKLGGGLTRDGNGLTVTDYANSSVIKTGSGNRRPITPAFQHESVFYGLAKASGDTTQSASSNVVGTYTDNAKASIKAMLGIQDGSTGTVDVSGTTPTIAAVENTRYVCGEVTSLNFTPPTSGISIVRFTSGSSVTVLTIPSTVKFPEWFDPTSLETNTIYEICVTDGVYGAVMSWAL